MLNKKIESGEPLSFFKIHSVAKLQKNEGGPFGENNVPDESLAMPKKTERGPLASSGILCKVLNRSFLVQFRGPTEKIWRLLKMFKTFGRTILVTSGVSQKQTKTVWFQSIWFVLY